MLEHLNRRFEGNFDTNQFSNWAFYNQVEQQIEMHLKSAIAQTVELNIFDKHCQSGLTQRRFVIATETKCREA